MESTPLTVPTQRAAVTAMRWVLPVPLFVWHCTAVSDVHILFSQADPPTRAAALESTTPSPDPETVTPLVVATSRFVKRTELVLNAS